MMALSSVTRGQHWFEQLTQHGAPLPSPCASLLAADVITAQGPVRYLSVVPDENNPFPRARNGEMGLLEGWGLGQLLRETLEADRSVTEKRAIVAVIDVPGQAYGRREEALGLNMALAAAVQGYAEARLNGHPVVGLMVGQAMSGAFLAHGYQANRLIALQDPGVVTQAMRKESAARITLRSVAELEKLCSEIAPMAYDVNHFASLGLLWRLLNVSNADTPSAQDVQQVQQTIEDAIQDIRQGDTSLQGRLAGENRSASRTVRQQMRAQW